jgi:Asp-tRNA(Asn)/Glu-tRNA(Gln) amidotransferase A subunit family amidase
LSARGGDGAAHEPPDFCAATTQEARAALAERQLAALAAREEVIRAFVCHDADAARRRVASAPPGPLAGALVGVKDIIATEAFPTRYGSRDPDAAAGPLHDAWCVGQLLRLGGVVLGKTVCTEFAFPLPGPTTNPHDARRTPGGSSSGSAAAVAAGFVSFALGTQTAGSTIRPASYCGVTGFKPSYGLLHTEGVQAISTTCDHLGLFARSPRDAWYFASALAESRADIVTPRRPRRVVMLGLPQELPQDAAYPERLGALATALRRDGVAVEAIDLPFPVEDFRTLQQELCYWEAARILLPPGPIRPVPQLRALLRPYLEKDIATYAASRRRRQDYQAQFAALAAGCDAVLLPAATGIAPELADTGDAVMNRFWTALHVPAMTIPMWRSEEGLPLGLQLIGGLGTDRALAEIAQWFHGRGRDRLKSDI